MAPGENAAIEDDILKADDRLQNLIATQSIDFLSPSTRSFMDKLLLVSAIGIVVSTFGVVQTEGSWGPFKITIDAVWIVPAALLLPIVFYSAGLYLLAYLDFGRWNAMYAQNIKEVASLHLRLMEMQSRGVEDFRDFSQNIENRVAKGENFEVDKEDIPTTLVKEADRVHQQSKAISCLLDQLSKPGLSMKRQALRQIFAFVSMPLMFGLLALLLCSWQVVSVFMLAQAAVAAP